MEIFWLFFGRMYRFDLLRFPPVPKLIFGRLGGVCVLEISSLLLCWPTGD
jgi:hypothetical protein